MTTKNTKPAFPCPYCKGTPRWHEFCLDDGSCADGQCGGCDGEGHIRVGGKIHQRMHADRIFWNLWSLNPFRGDNWGLMPDVYEKLESLSYEIVALASEESSWTQNEYCSVCKSILNMEEHYPMGWHVCSKKCFDVVFPMEWKKQYAETPV